jgi:two-component system, NtrC family, nitrogen regulation response regulator NtrX
MAQILIVDDEIGIRELLSEILRDEGFDILLAENAAAARKVRNVRRPDLVLLDIWMPDTDGITLLKEWLANGQLTMPVVMMSGHGTIDTAVEATRIGAIDYLEKPIALQKLLTSVRRGLQRHQNPPARQTLNMASLSQSTALLAARKRLETLSTRTRAIFLKTSPNGISEFVARTLLPPNGRFIEAAHVEGAFDLNVLSQAQGGLLYIPELRHLPRPQQKSLGFVLDRLDRFALRLVISTIHPLETLSAEGWDHGLLSRLEDSAVSLPSLSELRADLPVLMDQVMTHLAEQGEAPVRSLSAAARVQLQTQAWSGGYNELRETLKALALATQTPEIGVEDIKRFYAAHAENGFSLPLDLPLREAREAFERFYFEYHLRHEGSNMTRLAEKTGLERTHLYRKLKQLGLQAGRQKEET